MLNQPSTLSGFLLLGALLLPPSTSHAGASWSAYGECVMQDSEVGSCMGKQFLLDVTPVGEAVDDVRSTVQAGVEGARESVRQKVGSRVYDTASDVREAGSLTYRLQEPATRLLREEVSGNLSVEEMERKLNGSLYDWFKDSERTADDVAGTGALSSLFGIGDKADEVYESVSRKIDGATQSVEELGQGVRDLGQSARDGLGSLVGWDETIGEPITTEADVAFGTTTEERAVASVWPSSDSAEPEAPAADSHDERNEPGSGTGASHDFASGENPAPPYGASDDGAVAGEEEQAPPGNKERTSGPSYAEYWTNNGQGSGPEQVEVGVVDIDRYESKTVQELNREFDEEHKRILKETGGREVSVVRLEDHDTDAAPQEPEHNGPEEEDAQKPRDTLEQDQGSDGTLDPRLVAFALADAKQSRAISARREHAEGERQARSAVAFDTALQQFQATATQLNIEQQIRMLNARSAAQARARSSTAFFATASAPAPVPQTSSRDDAQGNYGGESELTRNGP